MSSIKKFLGEKAYNQIENSAYNADALKAALLTPQNARNVFADLSEFEIKSLVSEICDSGIMSKVCKATQDEIKSAFAEGGYSTVIFDDEPAIAECAKYYRDNERICTYNDLGRRMSNYHMIVAIKNNIDSITPFENPQREDEYGTSIINIQIARDGSHMSIKNRYNHTVAQCDSTFDNDLNHIKMGLQQMVLGYYGFAGLAKKSRKGYNRIVNIGNVYLKYHHVKYDIYFGAFVLDAVNGARYTDSARYYITNSDYPMVLDFHNKTAIDLTGSNTKAPLVTKAIQEGILHSGNKEEAETISVVFQNAQKELLRSHRKALKYIAEMYNYDFQKPYKVIGILGNFTAKSIAKATGCVNAILLSTDGEIIRIAKLNDGKFVIKDLRNNYHYRISTHYNLLQFETMRKSGTSAVYVIQQDKKYYRTKNNIQEAAIDPQRSLRERLQIYKANKRRAEALAADYTEDVKMIEDGFATLKAEIVSALISAETYEEYNSVTGVTNYNLVWLVRDIAKLKSKVKAKEFTSMQEAQDLISNVKTKILKIRQVLNLNKDADQ